MQVRLINFGSDKVSDLELGKTFKVKCCTYEAFIRFEKAKSFSTGKQEKKTET